MPVRDFHPGHRRLSLLEFRRHYPMAQLQAMVLNALGGKGDGKGLPDHKRFEPEELLPSYARPDALIRDLPLSPAQCAAVMEGVAAREIPSWVVQILHSIMPMPQIMRHGGARKRQNDGETDLDDWSKN
jgi:hypothetical protein